MRSQTSTEKMPLKLREQWLRMGDGRPFPSIIEDREAYVVTFEGPNDPWHPMSWPFTNK